LTFTTKKDKKKELSYSSPSTSEDRKKNPKGAIDLPFPGLTGKPKFEILRPEQK
jgi:hypothetical protein